MSLRMQGSVEAVTSQQQGGVMLSWQGQDMLVADAADFSREGGQFTLDGETVYTYTGVTEGLEDGDPDTVHTVEQGSVTDEARVDLCPLALDVTAEVEVDNGDTVPCVVPHMLRPLLADGMRTDDRENVVIEQQGQQWVVVEVVGRAALVQAEAIHPDVWQRAEQVAMESASGKSTVTHSLVDPASDVEGGAGDTWFTHAPSADPTGAPLSGPVVGMWLHDGTTWSRTELSGQVVGWLDAGRITTGSLSGIDIFTPSATATPRTHIGDGMLEVVRSDGEQEFRSVQLGGNNADQVMLYDALRNPIGGISSDGAVLGRTGEFDEQLVVEGTDVMERIHSMPGGMMEPLVFDLPANTAKAGTSELGICDMGMTAEPGHLYRVEVDAYWWVPANERAQVYLRQRTSGSGVIDIPAPTIAAASIVVKNAIIHAGSKAGNISGGMVAYWRSGYREPSGVRFLLTVRGMDSNTGVGVGSSGTMTITDLGQYGGDFADGQVNTGGGVPVSGVQSNPTTSKVTYTSTWNWSHVRSWQGSNTVTDALHFGNFGGLQRYGMAWFYGGAVSGEKGKTLQQALTGASNVRLSLRVTNQHFYSSTGGTVRIGHNNQTASATSPQTSGGEAFTSPHWAKGSTATFALPSTWAGGYASGAYTGVTFGEGAGTSADGYGKVRIRDKAGAYDPALIQLVATYTRG